MKIDMFKIEIYVPEEFVTPLRDQLNSIGACKVGDYDNVVSFSKVEGYWRPLSEATPYNGSKNEINSGSECKMEVRCPADLINQAISVITKVHPYEEPLVNIIPLVDMEIR